MKRIVCLSLSLLLLFTKVYCQFTQKKLNFGYSELEPYIDSTTMYIHYNNHHASYTSNLNKALEKYPEFQKLTIEELFQKSINFPEELQLAIRNNGGGFYNHNFFWSILTPASKSQISATFEKILASNFGSFDEFKSQFEKSALSRFGSGWVWLIKETDGSLKIISTPNQDNPIMPTANVKAKPILTLDVWEHAYYLKYQSKRIAYSKAFWNIVNWTEVEKLYFE
jgi:Fe-Mn family superoxide dismutase